MIPYFDFSDLLSQRMKGPLVTSGRSMETFRINACMRVVLGGGLCNASKVTTAELRQEVLILTCAIGNTVQKQDGFHEGNAPPPWVRLE